MTLYLDNLEELFSKPVERTFTDRSDVLELLNEALTKMNEGEKQYQIVSIHGIGGIGKTRLVKEFIKILSPEPVTYVSFEIEKRSEVINNLFQIRKNINSSCPFFDFALLRYWEAVNPSALNNDFMFLFKKGFYLNIIDLIAEITGCANSFLLGTISIPTIVSPSAIVDFMNSLYIKIPQLMHNDLFKLISSTSVSNLVDKLPILLGIEINRLITKGEIEYPVFIFDAYQESQPYSESEEWLFHLIKAAGRGLFIITSREPVQWNIQKDNLILHNLECYPQNEARMLLEETIKNRPDLVNTILESTQCIPIYIDLALNIYDTEKSIVGEELVTRALFHDRHKLVRRFISHLRTSWQSTVLNLATIRVFNYSIFEYLSKHRILECAPYEFNSIIKSNLFNYVSESANSSLIKLHDVFCRDAQAGREVSECYAIYKSYLEYICYRRDFLLQENNGASLAALFQNALFLAINLEERMVHENHSKSICKLETCVVESLLDIFFSLTSRRVRFVPLPYEKIKTDTMRKLCQFVYAKTYEKVNTIKTIKLLEEIDDTNCFGKHSLSYEAILFYTKSLTGHYDELEDWIHKIDKNLDAQTKSEWFYNRIKIYQADIDILRGRFQSALQSLMLLEDNLNSAEDYYSIHRAIGHIYRFNFTLIKACDKYNSLKKMYQNNTVFKEYLLANLVESKCYFPSSNFIKSTEKILYSMKNPYNIKNKGKVLYSLAIANTVKKHYKVAQKNINECIKLNQEDGYQSGILFAYMAQSYLDYALNGEISETTIRNIESLLLQNNVYTYFKLPLAMMKGDQNTIDLIQSEYEWLDFQYTTTEYERFLNQLRCN